MSAGPRAGSNVHAEPRRSGLGKQKAGMGTPEADLRGGKEYGRGPFGQISTVNLEGLQGQLQSHQK